MLDNETKRRIDTARDILVGKVPDPKSQVEQITIALIYKFMDDMDKEAIEFGGKPSFFVGDYERYAWSKIFDPRIGGHEMLGLYGEAIVKLNQNPNLPQLFRDIFKNAYLPYRDPETLKLFLKTINEFKYDHSERLGDAFEYLLSVLGSQGDAGQFRTPRHIIDFMVQVVNPQKHETNLDPACGTAGFLISSYKHILKENCKKIPGDLLTPEERKKLLTNFKGYDISPDMVRLSLVNMYLHGFVQPQIIEYDTLTSEDRWNEYADVILANPPFMTPKGGIKPHKRFSVQSNRSEVLFVDYIAEHLTPTGRAAVIVPEGIIFQSATAYKTLRKMLVENHLYAVVSLPAGVFNPYSGVKTSILLMDKQLAKKTDSILFVKIENDGFDLGAQRREIDKNDLPEALTCLNEWKKAILNKQDVQDSQDKQNKNVENPDNPDHPVKLFGGRSFALLVKKEKLAENGEYNLTGERYRTVETRKHQKWPMVKLGDFIEERKEKVKDKKLDVLSISNKEGFVKTIDFFEKKISSEDLSNYKIIKENFFAYNPARINVGSIAFNKKIIIGCVSPMYVVFEVINSNLISEFLFNIFKSENIKNLINSYSQGAVRQQLKFNDLINFQIPLPPIEVQREIVAEIEGYQKLIDGCRQVVDSWKPDIIGYLDDELKKYLNENPERRPELVEGWPMVKLGEVCEINPQSSDPVEIFGESEFVYIDITSVENGTGKVSYGNRISPTDAPSRARRLVKENDVLLSTVRPNLKAFALLKQIPSKVIASTGFAVLRSREVILPDLLYYLICSESAVNQMVNNMGKGAYPSINSSDVENLSIPLPPIEVQQEIVAKIESERKVIDGCRELIKTYEDKIKRVIDKVWEE
jgi:type I restriction enzyme M protein